MPNNGSTDQPIYLHGDLDLKIIEARHLPNMDLMVRHLRRCFTVCETFQCGSTPTRTGETSDGEGGERDIHHHAKLITSDPYVTVCVPQAVVARTRVIKNAKNPQWNEHFVIQLAHPLTELEFQVKDDDVLGSQLIGTAKIKASQIATGDKIEGWFPIVGSSGNPPKPETAIRLEMRFIPVEENPMYKNGIAADPEHKGVRRTYFPLRKGNSVRLYQDAHAPDGMLPEIKLDGGKVYGREKCWEDICYAISEAHHMIYITGWSIYHKIKIVREPSRPLPRGGDLNLGELLRYKSQEGVRVLLLVWDDKTSHDKLLINTAGMMQTHDEETRKFFKHSSVICVLAPRYASSKLSYMKQQVVGTLFTHHQKCVLVDTQGFGNNRKITAFLGGLDLCDGRYDTPEHRLFRDLDTVFEGDFHQPTIPVGSKAPRQPWHDMHCRIDGPAAYDVLLNFEQRWRKSSKWTELGLLLRKKVSHRQDDALIKIDRISWILSPSFSSEDGTLYKHHSITQVPDDDRKLWVTSEDDPENWHVQIFRSIDSGSLKGFPRDPRVAESLNLNFAKDLAIDRSIQAAYIHAIRSAQHFIYIENQYFLGSSYGWPDYKNAGADHLIPMELALKVASKIKAQERFAVYVVLPMWPEGDPKAGAMQEILFWQSQTMQMMYNIVARELKSMQLSDSHPKDYLNFYCLGNREQLPEEMKTANGTSVSDSYKFQRFMIYVHAKGMVVDDEYVIVGSANINQRSMAGTKDTEIAMGSYQPHQTWAAKNRHPRGQVYGYRMSLWAEHLGKVDACFEDPWNLDCVRTVNKISEDNWQRYTSENFMPLQGHLLRYPLLVDVDGKVGPLPGHENFPDVGGKVIGAHSPTIPDTLTT